MDRFKTLDDFKDKEKKENEDGKKKTNVYTGGEKSGLAVENPEDIHGILSKAEQKSGGAAGEVNCRITLYQNGFTVDDGPFREYNTPENQKFMKAMNQGYIPKELKDKYPKDIQIGIEDKRTEKYVPPPPPKYVEFSGQGVSLSGNKPGPETKEVNLNVQGPTVDDKQPKTTIQIRLHNGKTTQITLNVSDKVSKLFEYVRSVAPVQGNFQLITGFPAKPLTNLNLTLEEADLIESLVTQKI